MRGVLWRVRVFAGQFGLLAALVLAAGLLITAAPRLANDLTDRALREDVARLPYSARDVTLNGQPDPRDAAPVGPAQAALPVHRDRMPAPLPGLVSESWFAAGVEGAGFAPAGPRTRFSLRTQAGMADRVRMTAGRWPENGPQVTAVEVAVSTATAEQLGASVGTILKIDPATGVGAGAGLPRVAIVGVFEPLDRADRAWDTLRLALVPFPGLPGIPEVPPAVMPVTDGPGLDAAARSLGPVSLSWRYRLDETRLDGGSLQSVINALSEVKRTPPAPGLSTSTSLDGTLVRFDGQLRAVSALLAVVQAGLVATLLGLIGLAAALAVERRREEFALVRARGGTIAAIGGRALAESLVVLPLAAAAGWFAGSWVPGRPAATGGLVVGAGVVATLAIPVLAAASQRRLSFTARRQDLVRHRPSVRRLTAELFFLLIAGLGAYLLRRRGLSPDGSVDPYLASVPVLLAVGAAIVALRIFPWPLGQLGRLAARARGAVAFLGLARAGRGAPVTIGPLAVLVVAIATGIFSGVVMSSIGEARDRAADLEIPADARVSGYAFAPAVTDRLAAVPGVTAVAPLTVDPATSYTTAGGITSTVQVAVVDAAALARVVAASGTGVPLPAALVDARAGRGPVPALVSPDVAAEAGGRGVATVRGYGYDFTVAAVADTFPGVDTASGRFVVLPRQALPDPTVIAPDGFFVAGAASPEALRAVAAEGAAADVTVTTWAAHRRDLDQTGANEVLSFTFTTGTVGATALALLAVGFTVLAGARIRGQVLSRLRTLGLSGRQGRGLLVYELVPLVTIAVLAGGLVGVLLPRVIGPALGLSSFTSGAAVRTALDPLLVGAVLVLVAAALAVAVLVENVINRRMRLGEVLRVGEEGS
ncbi:ABC transporter permease [Phytohabitans sp. ZYX-F-186]|uniref:ABC transporter permease n=1 Tax=Phytohabitans maris TaxID=3071409 RepID=A0ABU0ZEK6_9ACTN|nr:ABC transporter permease [Phytohabitans sp. ZYX-F-186]MDQ7905472.1 ABC transporter permease [Phytohabitans sp. ZYX-F-186]